MKRTIQPARPREEMAPAELVNELLGVIRRQFYCDVEEKKFFQDRRLLLSWVVLWPAAWLNRRGVWLRPERYREVMLKVLDTVKVHGATGTVKYWPRYLATCVQSHFKIHAQEYLDEGKAARDRVERVMLGVGKPSAEAKAGEELVRSLAQAKAALGAPKRKRKVEKAALQGSLF